jgi:CubicO group peptidase (beta-lactamase class C family)
MNRLLVPLAFLVAVVARADEVDDLVRAEMVRSKAPAVAVAVVQDGKLVRSQAYGIIDLEHNVPATTSSVFRVASMSKEFCSAAMMLFVQDGRASTTDSIRKWLPDAPESWQGITLHHLLSHTSGIPDIGSEEGFSFETTMSSEDYLRKLYAKPLKRKPGEKFEYSNPGYSVLGLVVEKIAGQPLERVVEDRILRPVGMNSTGYYTRAGIVPNRAMGYERRGNELVNALFLRPPMMQGSGGLLSTVEDFAKWDAALRTNKPLDGELKKAIWGQQAKTEDEDFYGYGWFIQNRGGKRVVRHSGGTLGFTSNFLRYLDNGLTVIVLQNVASGGAVKLSEAIADHYLSLATKRLPSRVQMPLLAPLLAQL